MKTEAPPRMTRRVVLSNPATQLHTLHLTPSECPPGAHLWPQEDSLTATCPPEAWDRLGVWRHPPASPAPMLTSGKNFPMLGSLFPLILFL